MAISDMIGAEIARRSLIDFALRVSPGFMDARHTRYMTEQFEAVEAGLMDRLCLCAPPGSGKSTIMQLLLAWALGRHPERKWLMLSASEALAIRNSRVIRDIIASDAWPFPAVRISADSSSVQQWSTNFGGGLRAVGQGGTVTGFRASGGVICDDLQADAMSPATRDTLEDWFRGVLTTRLDPDAVVCLIQTRWSTDDLISRLQYGDSGDQWKFVNLPAIAKEGDPFGREVGESIWPERWPVELFEKRRKEVGSMVFSSQYMGEPTPEGGRIFNPEWFSERYTALPDERRNTEQNMRWYGTPWYQEQHDSAAITVTALDAAMKENIGGSFSALCSVRIIKNRCYVLEIERERAGMQRLLEMIGAHCKRNATHSLVIEDAAMGSAVIDVMKSRRKPYYVYPAKPVDSKEVRAMGIVPACEAKAVILPERAPWLDYFEQEIRDFPGSSSSDATDSFVWAVRWAWSIYNRELQHRRLMKQLEGDWMVR